LLPQFLINGGIFSHSVPLQFLHCFLVKDTVCTVLTTVKTVQFHDLLQSQAVPKDQYHINFLGGIIVIF